MVIEDVNSLNCSTSSVLLSGVNSSSGSDITYTWLDANQNVIGTSNEIVVDQAGDYTFVVSNTSNGCESEVPIQVEENFDLPDPTIIGTPLLNCVQTSFTIDAVDRANLENVGFEWINENNGTSLGSGTTLEIFAAGNYNLIATNLDNGCIAEFSFPISENVDTPIANAGDPFTITCTDTQATLDASASSGDNLSFAWYNQNQELVSEEISANTDQAGEYTLIVTNTQSGCTDESSVIIDINAAFPEIILNAPNILTLSLIHI